MHFEKIFANNNPSQASLLLYTVYMSLKDLLVIYLNSNKKVFKSSAYITSVQLCHTI